MLKKEGKIDDVFIRMIMGWRHTSGFSVHNGVRLSRHDEAGKEFLSQYIIRNPFSLDKVSYIEKSGMLIYRSRMTHGKNKKNYKLFSAIEFIAAITQHIPEKSFQLVRYYGWYSNRARGDRLKIEKALQEKANPETVNLPEIIDISDYRPKRIPSPAWRECIKKTRSLLLVAYLGSRPAGMSALSG